MRLYHAILPVHCPLLLAGALVLGCGSAPVNSYYTLANKPKVAKGTGDKKLCDKPLGVDSVLVSPPYDLRRIVFRPDSLEIRYYSRRYWASPPEDMVTKLVTRRLETSGLFHQVDSEMNLSRPHLTLQVKLHAIEELDMDKQWNAHLAMGFTLLNDDSGEVLWQHQFDATQKVVKQEIKEVITVLNDIFNAEMDKSLISLQGFLSSHREVCESE